MWVCLWVIYTRLPTKHFFRYYYHLTKSTKTQYTLIYYKPPSVAAELHALGSSNMHILLIEWSYRVIPRHLDMSKIWKQFDNLFDMMPPIGARCSVDNLCDHRIFFIGHISKFACIEIQWKKMKKVSVLKINSSALAVDMKNPKLIKRLFQIPCSTAVPSGRSRIDQTTERFTQDSPWRNLPSRWFESSKSTTAVGCWFGVFLKTADFIAETHLLPSDRSNWDDVSPSLQT